MKKKSSKNLAEARQRLFAKSSAKKLSIEKKKLQGVPEKARKTPEKAKKALEKSKKTPEKLKRPPQKPKKAAEKLNSKAASKSPFQTGRRPGAKGGRRGNQFLVREKIFGSKQLKKRILAKNLIKEQLRLELERMYSRDKKPN